MANVLVICAKRYNGHELWTLLGILQERGHAFEVVSQSTLIRDELTLQPNTIRRNVYMIGPEDCNKFDAVCIVSGNMEDTEAYWTDEHVGDIIIHFRAAKKVVAAICCSVPTIGPVAEGAVVSYFPLVRSRHRLQKYKAILSNVSLSVDTKHRIVTAENQMLTQQWAEEISNMLEGLPPEYIFQESGFTPKGSPRRMPAEVQEMIDEATTKE